MAPPIAAVLKTRLDDCSSLTAQANNLNGTVSRRELTQYVVDYNRCTRPDVPTTSFLSRSIQIELSPRLFFSIGSYKLQSFDGSLTASSTSWAILGYGADLNFS